MTSRSDLVRIVAGREIGVKLRDKAFIASTVVFVLIIVAAIAIPALISGGTSTYTVAATAEARPVAEAAAAIGGADERPPGLPRADLTIVDTADPVAALGDESVDAAVSLDGGVVVLTGRTGVAGDVRNLVTAASSALAAQAVADEAGLTSDQVAALTSPPAPRVDTLEESPDFAVPPELLGMVFGFLFYFTVLTFGIAIAQSVVEEKQSRVVEILVAALPVRWLLAGKVLGNGIMAIGQVILIVGAGLLGAQLTGASDIVNQAIGASGWFLAFFVLGFFMLASVWAVAGSLAARVEDLQSTTLYVQLAVMIPFFASVFLLEESPARRVLSYVPLSAPLIMPGRVASGDAAAWEPWVALAIVAATAVALVGVGARLYAGSVLNTSQRMKVVGAWKAGKGR
ncbi:ABC transporter permease [Demequina pelophila]|uniref:ABC transporter permease n=1 Tax=Demequina pelophila TaxID=1638984 RepID=UPI0007839856|nr:ABC transporter permease [Demequina pelophila]